MADDSTRIGGSQVGLNAGQMLRRVLAGDNVTNASAVPGPVVTGRPGQRMLSPDFPMDQLDHSAPRGTYVDLLV